MIDLINCLLLGSQLIDLSHTLHQAIPSWNGSCGFTQSIMVDYPQAGVRVHEIAMEAGIGTHIDAPAHFKSGAQTVDQIPLEHCIAPLYMISVADRAHADYDLTIADIESFEKKDGRIASGSFVFVHTGWDRYWHDPAAYRNADAHGHKHFPGVSVEAVQLLIERGIIGLGIDTLSPDGSHQDFPVHHLLFDNEIMIAENLTGGQLLPPTGAVIVILPLKIEQGTESPVRAIALLQKK